MKENGSNVIFMDGSVKAKDWVVISAELKALVDEEAEFTRVFSYKAGVWNHFDLEGVTVPSVYAQPPPGLGSYFLCRDGRVVALSPDGRKEERIPDAGAEKGKLGYLTRMRQIGERLYVCGAAGQVYRRNDNGWAHIDDGILDDGSRSNASLFGIDGKTEDNIYVVGQSGAMWRFDGKSWRKDAPQTANFLMGIRCVSEDEVFVCGRNGTFFRGHFGAWTDHSLPKSTKHFWAVEYFQGKAYLAASDGLYAFEGKKPVPLDTELTPTPDAYRLQANDGVLWSFGNHHLCFFDGKKWTYVKHPDNP